MTALPSAARMGTASAASAAEIPTWPTFSLAALPVLAVIFPIGLVTIMDVALLVLAAIVWITSRRSLPKPFYEMVLPYGGICVLGLASGLGADTYVYLKDAWYVLNPALVITVGYVLYRSKPDFPRILRAFVIGGTLLGALYLVPFFTHPGIIFLQATVSREVAGTGYYAPALAVMILAACWRDVPELLKIPTWVAGLCFVVCLAAIVMAFSRTIAIATVIGVFASFGLFARRAWVKFAVVALSFVGIISLLKLVVDLNFFDGQTFVGKLARSLDEMAIHEYFDLHRIGAGYRGYESARTLHTYEAADPWRWAIGAGFGATVDLKLWVPGVGRYIPIMHNSYLYLLFKGGAIAVGLFLFSLWKTFALGTHATSSKDRMEVISGRLLQGIAIALAVTTWVISGVFNKLDLYPFLLCAGALCGHLTSSAPSKP